MKLRHAAVHHARFCCLITGIVVLLGLLLPARIAFAQYPYTMGGGTVSLQAAQEKLRWTEAEVERLEKVAKAQLQRTPEWIEAREAADEAEKERDSIRAAILEELQQNPSYQRAQKKLEEAERIISLGNREQASVREVTAATNDAIDARIEISRMEGDALSSSRQYRAAEERLRLANERLEELWETARENELVNNPAFRAAVTNHQLAEDEYERAQAAVRAARQQAAQQQRYSRPERTVRSRGTSNRRSRY